MIEKSITLIGMPASGKSKVGRYLSEILHVPFVDTDILIIQHFQAATLKEVVDTCKRDFTAIEESFGIQAAFLPQPSVIAPGGSIIFCEKAMRFLSQRTHIVYLDASFETIERRVPNPAERAVIMEPGEKFIDVYNKRTPLYRHWAHRTVNAEGHRKALAEQLAVSFQKRKVAA